eukprot:5533648-Amphidinium_carterae.1
MKMADVEGVRGDSLCLPTCMLGKESDKILNVVLSIQPREGGSGGGRSAEEWSSVSRLVPTQLSTAEQSARLPAKLTDETAHAH